MFTFFGFASHSHSASPCACSPSSRNVNIALVLNDQLYPLVVQCTIVSKRAEKVALHACAQSRMQSIAPRRLNRAKCSYRPLQWAEMFIPSAPTGGNVPTARFNWRNVHTAASTSKMFIPPDTWLPAANYTLARNPTFSTNLDTKRRVYLKRHGGDLMIDFQLLHFSKKKLRKIQTFILLKTANRNITYQLLTLFQFYSIRMLLMI